MEISKHTKKIDPTSNKKQQVLIIKEKRKIQLVRNTKNNKTYYSYQINIPKDYLMLIQDDYEYNEKISYLMHFIEINRQHYVIKLAPYGVNNILTFPRIFGYIGNDPRKKYFQFTLPKKDMQYLQAFDKYQDVINKINSSINNEDEKIAKPLLYSNMYFVQYFDVKNMQFEYELHLSIDSNIDDKVIEYLENDLAESVAIPGWLETLLTDWNANNKKIKEKIGIQDKDYDLNYYAGNKK